MYPSDTNSRIQRPTVPECSECKKIWQDAENQFRNVMVIAGTPNRAVMEQWEGPVKRSFNKPSGGKWSRALVEQMVAIENTEGPLYKIYPANNPEVMLVIRKIIRGQAQYCSVYILLHAAKQDYSRGDTSKRQPILLQFDNKT
jgi:hypothetical protein